VTAIDRQQTRINEQIRISPIRLIGVDGSQLGIVPTDEALRRPGGGSRSGGGGPAGEAAGVPDHGLREVQVPTEQKAGEEHAHHTKTKEIRLRPKTGEHDVEFKVKRAKQFWSTRTRSRFRCCSRRELAHVEEGQRVMASVIEELSEVGKLESPPNRWAGASSARWHRSDFKCRAWLGQQQQLLLEPLAGLHEDRLPAGT